MAVQKVQPIANQNSDLTFHVNSTNLLQASSESVQKSQSKFNSILINTWLAIKNSLEIIVNQESHL